MRAAEPRRSRLGAVLLLAAWIVAPAVGRGDPDAVRGGRIFQQRCASCHGLDGSGQAGRDAGLEPANFTDCSFSSREPDADWIAVVSAGGPVRGLSPAMPAHGAILSEAEIRDVVAFARTLCEDPRWPRGELNLPRPLFTEKAFPEDEFVVTTLANLEDETRWDTELLFEKRFGARNQIEISLPIVVREEPTPGDATWGGVGDVGLSVKRVLFSDLAAGFIASLGTEVKLPTGDDDRGLGTGTTVFEPFVAFGQLLPVGLFAQLQVLGEIPVDGDKADSEVQVRAALGRSFEPRRFGRLWTPMVELLATRSFGGDRQLEFDLVPQIQVTLSRRRHVRLDLGGRIPVNHTDGRPSQLVVYLLWDWFDGWFYEGW